jgi:hypothetical protein
MLRRFDDGISMLRKDMGAERPMARPLEHW